MNEALQHKIRTLPDSPGCYLMKHQGEIIYIGKAKNLKNRVRQYFHAIEAHTPKVRAMVSRVDDFDIILCRNNFEALTLECNLIKHHRPFYNILLKDDKHLWPAYNLVPLVRNSTLKSHPKMAKALNQVDKKLTTKTLTELNKKVDVDGQNYQTVAKNWFNKNIN